MNLSYYGEMPYALPGQVSDTSRYNIDGACVFNPEASQPQFVACGVAVKVGTVDSDGVKDIKPISGGTAGQKAYGVAIRSHFATTTRGNEMVYTPGDGINVMTVGRVWMVADEKTLAGSFGETVHIDPSSGKCTKSETANKIDTAWTYTGSKTTVKGAKEADNIYLLEVQLRQA